jgi:predicted secreted protein
MFDIDVRRRLASAAVTAVAWSVATASTAIALTPEPFPSASPAQPALEAAAAPGRAAGCTNTTVRANASGRSLVLQRCDRLTIRLTESFDGGYAWTVSHRPASRILELVSNQAVRTEPAGVVGGTDERVVVYRAVGTGTTSLRLIESRSLQRGSQIATFALSVRVS